MSDLIIQIIAGLLTAAIIAGVQKLRSKNK